MFKKLWFQFLKALAMLAGVVLAVDMTVMERYQLLACMTDEHQIQPRAVGRLRALQVSYSCG